MLRWKLEKNILNSLFFATLIITSLIYETSSCSAKTYCVSKSGDDTQTGESWNQAFLTIKKAEGLANSGDNIWVAKGTYTEGSTIEVKSGISIYGGFEGNEISIEERDISINRTIIDGNKTYQCVYNYFGIIDGFHIINGLYSSTRNGGGINNYGGNVLNCTIYSNSATFGGGIHNIGGTITNCVLYSNSATDFGGGIYSYESSTISNCTIYSNTAKNGGGIHNSFSSVVKNCEIYKNLIQGSNAEGGGIYNAALGTISNCKIYSNSAMGNYSQGGGIQNDYNGKILNCTLYSNSSDSNGGGIYNGGTIMNCLLYSNSAYYRGGGIFGGTIINCTVYSNYSYFSGSGIHNSQGLILNSIIWNNKNAGDVYLKGSTNPTSKILYSCYGEADGTNGNFRANPCFINTAGDISTFDFHLKKQSPCIDSGTTDTIMLPDMEGNLRPGGDNKIDIGVYESPEEYLQGTPLPVIRLYVSKTGNNTDGLSWLKAFTSIKSAMNSLDDNVYEIWTAKGIYKEGENIIVPSRCELAGGFEGTEKFNNNRKILTSQTTIDGENKYRCVYNYGTIDGFNIKNGFTKDSPGGIPGVSGHGGGIRNISGTVKNCSIFNNSISYGAGGGIDNESGGQITDCVIYSNSASYADGGGIENWDSSIVNSSIYTNTSDYSGGGINNWGGDITNCRIYSNLSDYGNGGGIFNYDGTIMNCMIYSNSATEEYGTGGGICNNYTGNTGTVSNCLIYANSAGDSGGGIDNSSIITNCSVYNNSSSNYGGGINNYNGTIINSIAFSNKIAGDIYGNYSKVSYSCFKEASNTNGNIKTDPLFVNKEGSISTWNFHLKSNSPCIDKGTTVSLKMDIEGTERPKGNAFDMGAYEYYFATSKLRNIFVLF